MAIMKPKSVTTFQNRSEETSYQLLANLDNSYTVVYEPSIGLQKRRTPDFVILSEEYGLIVLDVKYVKLENIKKSDSQAIIKTDGKRMKNFYQIVKDYAYIINNQLVKEFQSNSSIVQSISSKYAGKLKFPHSSGLLLFIHDEKKYMKSDVAKILSLNEDDFLIVNKIQNTENELKSFIQKLNRPFAKGVSQIMQREILRKIYIDSDASAYDFINTISQFNISINQNFKDELYGTTFEKSKQLKINLLEYTKFAQNTIDVANKNLGLGCDNIIERLKGYKQELESEKFTVAIFGYFSTGKSTFLNTLMKTDKLPMDEDRSTATFTRLRHCDESEDYENGDMQVVYKDKLDISIAYKKAISELDFEEEDEKKYLEFNQLNSFKDELEESLKDIKIRDYGSEQRDKIKNAKKFLSFIINYNVPYGTSNKVPKEDINQFLTDDKKAFGISEVIYYLDNDLLKDIEIVDTPGYGSENTMDTFKTQEFLKEANVLILLTEAKDPMSKEDEHKFLENYSNIYKNEAGIVDSENLFIVANKIDESTKTPQKIKESIKQKIEDNWEDSIILKDEKIFTMSSKYHYEKIFENENIIFSENINDNDLENFVENYSTYLTKNKDKEIIKSSFKNIDSSIIELNINFNKIVLELDRDINDIQRKKERFQANKEDIVKTYALFSDSMSSNINILHDQIKNKLDKQKLNSVTETIGAFTRYLENKKRSMTMANKKNSKEFYTQLTTKIYEIALEENNSLLIAKLKENVKFINKKIAKESKELEEEYNIHGLEKEISIENINIEFLKVIEFEKDFLRIILDVVLVGRGKFIDYYAKQMHEEWENITYSKILHSIDDSNEETIKKIQKDFKEQSSKIVESIGTKLNDIEKNIIKKQKDREDYDAKINKMKTIFEKIERLKLTIKKQENDLYS